MFLLHKRLEGKLIAFILYELGTRWYSLTALLWFQQYSAACNTAHVILFLLHKRLEGKLIEFILYELGTRWYSLTALGFFVYDILKPQTTGSVIFSLL